MAKAILTLEDTGDGSISIVLSFDHKTLWNERGTPAQYLALKLIETAAQMHNEPITEMAHYAYCSPEGVIRLGDVVPEGFIGLCAGPRDAVIDIISDTALFGENGTGDTVPFIPGTHRQKRLDSNYEAIIRFTQRLQKLDWPGIRLLGV